MKEEIEMEDLSYRIVESIQPNHLKMLFYSIGRALINQINFYYAITRQPKKLTVP